MSWTTRCSHAQCTCLHLWCVPPHACLLHLVLSDAVITCRGAQGYRIETTCPD